MSEHSAILVAAGEGIRAGGDCPKQFCELGGRPVLWWSARVLVEHRAIGSVLVMVPPDRIEQARQMLSGLEKVQILAGGRTRAQTVRLAVGKLARAQILPRQVWVHDAARPGLSPEMLDVLMQALGAGDGVAPALPVPDALVRQTQEEIQSLDRRGVYRVQTPQGFAFASLRSAMQTIEDAGDFESCPDEMILLREAGFSTQLVPGDNRLSKITWEEDFAMLERLLWPQIASEMAPRVGTGFDVHAFASGGDRVILCGVSIAHDRALKGHSDADVGFHALTDAILGAVAEGDIGRHFPPSEPEWKDVSSALFLTHARELARQKGYGIGNADLTLICEAPRIGPHCGAMRAVTAKLLGCAIEAISIKATTTEKLGAMGRGEGIAAQAIVTLVRR